MMRVSVCTLAHGRAAHMRNLVAGLTMSERQPDELIIAVMQDGLYELPETSFPIHQIELGEQGIPLAMARNSAATAAIGDLLVFLDVDCIPTPKLIGDYHRAAQGDLGLMMGEVGYLPKSACTDSLDFASFERLAVSHAERAGPPAGDHAVCRDYRCFWSLNFAMAATDFQKAGGFDERFVGYGGEDTDFGRSVAVADIPMYWLRGAKAYHQHHAHHMPPVHHLDSVLANALQFQEKWGEPTMQHWLRAFVLMGLIARTADGWKKLRDPVAADLALTRQQEDQPYASSAAVLDMLEAAAAGARERAAPAIAAK